MFSTVVRRCGPLLLVVAAAGLTVAGCGGGGDSGGEGKSTKPVKVGLVFPLTGPVAFIGGQGQKGAKLAVKEINAAGGVLGRKIELDTVDSRCEPVEGVAAARQQISNGSRILLGEGCSSVTLAMMPVVKATQSLLLNTMSSDPAITKAAGVGGNPWVFRTIPPDDAFAPAIGEIMVKQFAEKRIAVVASNNDFGRGFATAFKSTIEGLGGSVSSTAYYGLDGPFDFSSDLAKIKASKADAVVFIGTIEPGIPFVRQYREQGLEQRLYTRGVSLTKELFDAVGKRADGLYSSEPYYAEIDSPENKQFLEKFRAEYNMDPVYQAVTTYEGIKMIANAIKKAGTDDPTKVRDALKATDYPSIMGPVKFDDHDQAHTKVFVATVKCPTAKTCKIGVAGSR